MSNAGPLIFAIVLLVSPIALIILTVLWLKALKQRGAAQQALADHEAEANARLEAIRDEGEAKVQKLLGRFPGLPGLVSLDAEKERVSDDIARLRGMSESLSGQYQEKKAIYDRLITEVAIFDERLAFAEMGFYEPHFGYGDSDAYKTAIQNNRDNQKRMISDKTAVYCNTEWTVSGSAAKGQTMTNRNIRLTLRAFNSECDAAVASTRWNNVNAMEKRILRAKEQIEKLNASNSIYIDSRFFDLKLEELYLTYEFREKQKAGREERAEELRLARDEQKLLRDLEDAQEEEARHARLLAQAKAEAERAVGPKLEAFTKHIQVLERDLAKAHEKAERAQAMAERTRSGYVYIISNIGSFGEGVVKIGLTRRLDPMDRVRELGDASVPFTFDTHAIIYSDDAPTLERALHTEFDPVRINAQNYRKEFFRAELSDVEAAVLRLAPDATFFKDVEAQEYRETLSRRRQSLEATEGREAFPASI